MAQIIRKRAIVEDDFVHVADADELPATGKPIVTLARYVKAARELHERYAALGVQLASDKLPSDIPQISFLALIAIEFPRFTEHLLEMVYPHYLASTPDLWRAKRDSLRPTLFVLRQIWNIEVGERQNDNFAQVILERGDRVVTGRLFVPGFPRSVLVEFHTRPVP